MKVHKKRIIVRLDIKGNRLIKGIRFEGLRVIGDAVDSANKYANDGIDEIFYSDAVASLYGRNNLDEILRKTSRNIFVPITVGGGVRNIDDGTRILAAGADKLAINTAAVKNPNLIKDLGIRFGKQCVVLSIQAKKNSLMKSGWEVMIESGRQKTDLDILDWIAKTQEIGIGELLITSVDQDGTQKGPDMELLKILENQIEVPLIYGGGVKNNNQILNVMKNKDISAISIGTSFHKKDIEIKSVKKFLMGNNIPIRNCGSIRIGDINDIFKKLNVIVLDYGMGNQQSLINALKNIGVTPVISYDKQLVLDADILFIPGVGAFSQGMKQFKERELINVIKKRFELKKPIFTICLGMQLLFEKSYEFGKYYGLDLLKGEIKEFCRDQKSKDYIEDKSNKLKLPHVGWNEIKKIDGNADSKITSILLNNSFYFVHSFGLFNKIKSDWIAFSSYEGIDFVAALRFRNVISCQFHPERSGNAGLELLKELILSFDSI